MPSVALQRWQTDARTALDRVAAAHVAVGGGGRGRRHATTEINHAYAVLLSSQFQRFCRDLHTEAVEHIVAGVGLVAPDAGPAAVRFVLRARLLEGRKLDQGNPNPSNLGSDFGRFGFNFWTAVRGADARSERQQVLLEQLAAWRNAIAHQDFPQAGLTPPPPLHLEHVRRWRAACDSLAVTFTRVVGAQIAALVGAPPW